MENGPVTGVATIIVNYRTPGLTVEALRSLAAPGERLGRVIVVENGSGDDSAAQLAAAIRAEGWQDWAELIPVTTNRGFAAGSNVGLCHALGGQPSEFLLLLNPDTVVRPDAVRTLVEFLRRHKRAGLAGSRLEDPDGLPQRSAFRFPGVLSELEGGLRFGPATRLLHRQVIAPPIRHDAHRTDWVAGASLMIRRSVIEDIGLLDEGFFLYFEEVDYCRRARAAGWECWYVPQSRVVHLVGQASGVTDNRQPPRRVPDYWFESRRRYFRRHHGVVYARAADCAWAAGFALWRLRRRLQRKPDGDPPRLLGDFVRHALRSGVA